MVLWTRPLIYTGFHFKVEIAFKVYYNGPYVSDKLVTVPITTAPKLQVTPNPNNGVFEITLSGNIYGSIKAKIYNSGGADSVPEEFW